MAIFFTKWSDINLYPLKIHKNGILPYAVISQTVLTNLKIRLIHFER